MADHLREQRIDLACALRWAARLGLHEGVCNHFSLAVADEDGVVRGDRFLINPYGWHWSEITASSLVLCDAEGKVLEGDTGRADGLLHPLAHPPEGAPGGLRAAHPHALCHRADPAREGRLQMCEQNALMFYGRLAYDDEYGGLALDGSRATAWPPSSAMPAP